MDEMSQHSPVKELVVTLPGKELKLFVTADFEGLITDLTDEDKVPCWAEVWPAAYGLARHLWEQTRFSPGEEVLELGAGMGLPGIVSGLKGARVTLSDFNRQALEMSRVNARANGVEAHFLEADWRSFAPGKKYDCMLASDILYDPKLNPYLGDIFQRNLKPGGRIFVSHPQRPATDLFLKDWYNPALFEEEVFWEVVELQNSLLPRYHIAVHLFSGR